MAIFVEHPDRQPPENCDPTRLDTPTRFAIRGAVRALVDEALAAEVQSMLETSFLRNVPDC
jgi:hypothetical protein